MAAVEDVTPAAAAGFLLSAVARGADRYLTVAPRPLLMTVALLLLLIAVLRKPHGRIECYRTRAAGFLAGLIASVPLPLTPLAPPAGVVTAHVGRGFAGDLFEALERIDQDPGAMDGSTITVSGEWTPSTAEGAATVSRRLMACCAADTVAVGLDVFSDRRYSVAAGTIVVVTGNVRARIWKGDVRYGLAQARVRPLR
jgi:hypothetical protein